MNRAGTDERGQVVERAGGFQLLTRPEYHPWLIRMRRGGTELRLSPAARETLAIIAYRQPIMRADVEAIRGVQIKLHRRRRRRFLRGELRPLVRVLFSAGAGGRPTVWRAAHPTHPSRGFRSPAAAGPRRLP